MRLKTQFPMAGDYLGRLRAVLEATRDISYDTFDRWAQGWQDPELPVAVPEKAVLEAQLTEIPTERLPEVIGRELARSDQIRRRASRIPEGPTTAELVQRLVTDPESAARDRDAILARADRLSAPDILRLALLATGTASTGQRALAAELLATRSAKHSLPEDAARALVPALSDSKESVPENAAKALGNHPFSNSVADRLAAQLGREDFKVTARAMKLLAQHRGAHRLDGTRGPHSLSPDQRQAAIGFLQRLDANADNPCLRVSEAGITEDFVLTALNGDDLTLDELEIVARRLHTDNVPKRDAVLTVLGEGRGFVQRYANRAIVELSGPAWRGAARALQGRTDFAPNQLDALLNFASLATRSADTLRVRTAALEALAGNALDPPRVQRVVDALDSSAGPEPVIAALQVLSSQLLTGPQRATVGKKFTWDNPQVRACAAAVCRSQPDLTDPEVNQIASLIGDRDPEVRSHVLEAYRTHPLTETRFGIILNALRSTDRETLRFTRMVLDAVGPLDADQVNRVADVPTAAAAAYVTDTVLPGGPLALAPFSLAPLGAPGD